MQVFETVLVLLLGATILSTFARRYNIAYPTLIAIGGAILAFFPGAPKLELPPDLILALFVAPVLLDAAYGVSLRDLRRNWLSVSSLVIVAVAATTVAVAVSVRLLIPDMPWAAAIALGALVAPPDAVAALAILKQVEPPNEIRVVLEGESLLNDATSLLIYRLAVGAVAAGSFSVSEAVPAFALVFFGSLVAGWLISFPANILIARIQDAPSSAIVQFVSVFGIWIAAEHLGLSGVVTIVVFGLALARRNIAPMSAYLRLPSFAIWETATLVLNVLAFTLIGLQLRPILDALTEAQLVRYLGAALVLLVVVIVVRMVWLLIHHSIATFTYSAARARMQSGSEPAPTVKDAFVVGWSGMRGIVTLAAAMALPAGFPYRDFIQLAAFVVVLGTLVIQGLTLRPLLIFLRLPKDSIVETELKLARETSLKAAIAVLDKEDTPVAQSLKKEYEHSLQVARDGGDPRDTEKNVLRLKLVAAGRKAIDDLRNSGAIGDPVYRQAEEELDHVEISARVADAD